MHGTLGGSGALIWVFGILYYATAVLALFVAIDSLRRRRTDFAPGPEGRLFYAVPQVLFVGAFLFGTLSSSFRSAGFGLLMLTASPVAFAHQVAYLLRVVFPTRERREVRAAVAARSPVRAERAVEATGEGPRPGAAEAD